MSVCTSVIKQIDCEFDDIYRITAENGLVLDISEIKKPTIGSRIEYYIDDNIDCGPTYTIMNGIFFGVNAHGILVSFGGLLGNIPVSSEKIKENVTLIYRIF